MVSKPSPLNMNKLIQLAVTTERTSAETPSEDIKTKLEFNKPVPSILTKNLYEFNL